MTSLTPLWYGMNKEIENLVKTCKNCALAAKAPPVKFNPWPNTDKSWSRLHSDYPSPLKGTYYFIVVDSLKFVNVKHQLIVSR